MAPTTTAFPAVILQAGSRVPTSPSTTEKISTWLLRHRCLKGRELANLCAETLDEPIRAAQRGVERVRSDEDLLFGFLKAAGLSL